MFVRITWQVNQTKETYFRSHAPIEYYIDKVSDVINIDDSNTDNLIIKHWLKQFDYKTCKYTDDYKYEVTTYYKTTSASLVTDK